MSTFTRCIIPAAASLATLSWLAPALAGPSEDAMDQQVEIAAQVAEAQAHEAWRANLTRIEAPREGCFRADYPSIEWVETGCQTVVPRVAPRPPSRSVSASRGAAQTTGNGHDYVIQTAGLIKST